MVDSDENIIDKIREWEYKNSTFQVMKHKWRLETPKDISALTYFSDTPRLIKHDLPLRYIMNRKTASKSDNQILVK